MKTEKLTKKFTHSQTEPGAFAEAAADQDMDEMRRLLACGANINEKTMHGVTALMWAAIHGNIEMAQFLIDNGASLGEKNIIHGRTALHLAISHHEKGSVRFLLDNGASLNEKDTFGRTALEIAMNLDFPATEIIQMVQDEPARRLHLKAEARKQALKGAVVLQHDLRRPKLKLRRKS